MRFAHCARPGVGGNGSSGSRLCENALRRRAENLFPCRALTTDVRKFLGSVFLQSRLKFYFEKQRPSFHTAWVKTGKAQSEHITSAIPL